MKLSYPSVLNIADNLRLRQLTESDIDAVFDYASDDDFAKHLGINAYTDKQQAAEFIHNINQQIEDGQRLYWGIELEGAIAGTIGFLNVNEQELSLEIGFGIAKPLWGKGVVNQCMEFLICYAEDKVHAKKLIVGTHPDNIKAIEFTKKFSFREDGIRQDRIYFSRILN